MKFCQTPSSTMEEPSSSIRDSLSLSLSLSPPSGGVVPRAVTGSDFGYSRVMAGKPAIAKTDSRRNRAPRILPMRGDLYEATTATQYSKKNQVLLHRA